MNKMDAIFKIKGAWDKFCNGHPKFPLFLNAVKQRGIPEGAVLEIGITYPDGQVLSTNVKVSAEDLELFETLKSIN